MYAAMTAFAEQPTQAGTGGVRVGDRERDKAIACLGQAFAQGYLSMQEYEGRVARAQEAQTAGALNQPLSDLPVKRIAWADPHRREASLAVARRGVRIHLAAYLAAALLMIGIWAATVAGVGFYYFWPVWPILGMGAGWVFHALGVQACANSRRATAAG
jgi:Domain of unknown function (DUF1707)/2TM domain